MQTVSAAIREDLARVKDVLDIYVRTGMERVEELAPQVELLKKIGDTLGVLGLGELREIIQVRRAELEELVAGRRRPDESVLVTMATALLEVEDRIEPLLIGMISPDAATAYDAGGREGRTTWAAAYYPGRDARVSGQPDARQGSHQRGDRAGRRRRCTGCNSDPVARDHRRIADG